MSMSGEDGTIAAYPDDSAYHDALAHILTTEHRRPPSTRDIRLCRDCRIRVTARPAARREDRRHGRTAAGGCGEDDLVTYIIAEPCVDLLDRACVEECPVDCIYEGNRMLYIHPDECVDCGACEPVCPVEAIFYEDDVPQQWKDYTAANYEFFEDLGSPGGASKIGKIDKDTPFIAGLPPREVEH